MTLTCFVYACTSKKNETEVLTEIKVLHKKAFKNRDSTLIKLNKVRNFIKHYSFVSDSIEAKNNYMLANYYRFKKLNDSATIYFHKAKDFVKDSISNKLELKYFFNCWKFHNQQGNYGDCFTVINDYKDLVKTEDSYYQYMLENTYKAKGDIKKALTHNKLQIKAKLQEGKNVNDISENLIIQAQYELKLKNKQRAFFLLDSISKYEHKLNTSTKHNLFRELGIHKFYKKEYANSLRYYLKALYFLTKGKKNVNSKNEIAGLHKNISESYIHLKAFQKAQLHLDSAKALVGGNVKSTTKRSILQTQLHLSFLTDKKIDLINNSFDSLYNYQENEYTKKFQNELVELKKASEREKKIIAEKNDLEIKSLKRLFGLIVLVVIFITIGYLFYKQRKYNFEKQNLQMQQRLLRLQMNPHFTFNTLYAIQNKIEDTPKLAIKYLLKFSRLLRLILENSTQNYIQLNEEIDALQKFIELQQLRFPDTFQFQLNLKNLNQDDLIFIPPMLIQPFIENSIEHGLSGINYPGQITLSLTQQNVTLLCVIEDNGIGLSSDNKSSKASSTKLIDTYLKKVTNKGINLKNKSNGTGVIVTFEIPYKLSDND
ncbi:sensor histidine kinase [Tenacibaculum jejuense]|uniref:Two-component system sensor histidine kinase n=1 Tax=Tenacibaculum jejuense TaxID=584609 RepID=A0A238UAM8_9FLAO|nr:histidine kinase [Tenacibaculum jejuense]SNR15628.1 Two-component system sensor histidine kinase [Tenacibaculum jejuense]